MNNRFKQEIIDIIDTFLKYNTEVSEGKLKSLFVIPVLVKCYLGTGKVLEDVYENFFISKEGQSGADIKIKSVDSCTLIELKAPGTEIFDCCNGRSEKVYPGGLKLGRKLNKGSLLIGYKKGQSEKLLFNLADDHLGQACRYVLQVYLTEEFKKVNLIITNGIDWLYMSFNEEKLKNIYQDLENSTCEVASSEYIFKILNLKEIFDLMTKISLREKENVEKLLKDLSVFLNAS